MADTRIHKTIASRADLQFHRQPNRMRRWRSLVTWWTLGVSVLVAIAILVHDDRRVYWSGKTSSAHELFANDCGKCHDKHFQPIARLATLDNNRHSVSDRACQECHKDFASDDHQANIDQRDLQSVHSCVVCHREHSGRNMLAAVADDRCVACHGDLKTNDETEPHFAARIHSFADHPEFALLRAAGKVRLGDRHQIYQVADYVNGNWTDRAQIKFNHQRHLVADGVPLPPVPGNPDGPVRRRKLSCADCHVPDVQGEYIQPIRYTDHCQQCHKLEYSTRLAGDLSEPQPLPHVEPDLIRGVLRDRLLAFAKSNPDAVLDAQAKNDDEPPFRHPNKERASKFTAKDQWTWVERVRGAMEHAVLHGTSDEAADQDAPEAVLAREIVSHISYGCKHCHAVDAASLGGLMNWSVRPTNIPNRWLAHGRFDHRRHAQVACVKCHNTAESETATDILMPSISVCQQCHGDSDRTQITPALSGTTGRARAQCVVCHDYHH
jgi:predicted CXXCH cytochrome family protein